jgi:ABC-type polysaccharide/polyol phosphate export permease
MIKKLWNLLVSFVPENNTIERIWILAKTDFKKRYYETRLGLLWAFINPLFRFSIYYFIFTTVFESKIENYAFYLFLGLIIWMFFVETTKRGMTALKSKLYIIENVEVNIIELFFASITSSFIGYLFNLTVFICFFIIGGLDITYHMLLLPFLILILLCINFGITLILAVIHLVYRDISMLWDMIVLAGFWISPVLFRGDLINETLPFISYINPFSSLIPAFRDIMIYNTFPEISWIMINIIQASLLIVLGINGLRYFKNKLVENLV